MGNNKQKLTDNEDKNVAGGFIVQVDPEELRELHLNLKPFLVVSQESRKVVGSYDTLEEAEHSDYLELAHIHKCGGRSILDKGELKGRIFSNGEGEFMYKRCWPFF